MKTVKRYLFVAKNPRNSIWCIKLSFFLFYVAVIIKSSWIGDDCLITCRTIYNFVNGYGLTWNTAERVQTFTHPLWLLCITPFYALTHDFPSTITVLSVLFSAGAVSLLVFSVLPNSYSSIICLLCIIFSKPFVDYSSSGLENSLSHFLFVGFLFYITQNNLNQKTLFLLSFLFSLSLTNRQDTLLLYFPLFVYIVINARNRGEKFLLDYTCGDVSVFIVGILFCNLLWFFISKYILRKNLYRHSFTGFT